MKVSDFNEYIERLKNIPVYDEDYCYKMGYDCGKNGADTTNSHFALFASSDKTKAWERGKKDAERPGNGRL